MWQIVSVVKCPGRHCAAPPLVLVCVSLPIFVICAVPDPSSGRPLIELSALNAKVAEFARERDWEQFHSPKNLAMALTNEVGELVEIFQWLTEEQSRGVGADPRTAEAVRDELADVQIYLSRLAHVLGVDMNEAVTRKIAKNAQKYPADKVRGTNKKYTEF